MFLPTRMTVRGYEKYIRQRGHKDIVDITWAEVSVDLGRYKGRV